MDEGFEYIAEMKDRVSGPAKHASGELRLLHVELGNIREALSDIGGTVTIAELLAHGIEGIGEAAVEAAKKTVEVGIEATKFAIEAAEFKHNTEIAYAAVQGTAEEGEKTFAVIDEVARKAHLPATKAHEIASQLMLQGVEDTKLVGQVVEAEASLIRTKQLQGAEKLKSIIERSAASGHFELKGIGAHGGPMTGRALAGIGIHLPELIQDIANRTHHSVAQVKQELAQGKIATEVGVAALTEAIGKGSIGRAAQQKFDFGDFAADMENKWRAMVQNIDLAPIERGFAEVSDTFSHMLGDGTGVQTVFQTIVDAIGTAIDKAVLFAQGIEISFLEADIAAQPLIQTISHIDDGVRKLTGGIIGTAFDVVGGLIKEATIGPIASPTVSPAHAAGGEVMKPAPGEFFASVAPGERIVPAFDADSGAGISQPVSVDVGGVHVHVHGATDGKKFAEEFIPLLEDQVADVFERAGLEMGR